MVMANISNGVNFQPFYDCYHSGGIPRGILKQYCPGIPPPTLLKGKTTIKLSLQQLMTLRQPHTVR
ncbi:hypothetical protein TSUD_195160 [Trifolium subterraneum]|nr:hypothetical protein TSUD_195160 [Trifolium subterraneum]